MKIPTVLLTLALAAFLATTGAAAGTSPTDLPQSYLFSPPGKLAPLHAGLTYGATTFPLAFQVTPPDASWGGAQWKQNSFSPYDIEEHHYTCSTNPKICAPPYVGWVAIGQGGADPNGAPRDLILVLAGYEKTPSVAATVESLRTRGHGATFEAPTKVTLGGITGMQLDGQVVGKTHVFVPFSPPTNKATAYPDAISMDGPGHAFRILVLDVRGRTVVVFVSSIVMSPAQFTAFLPRADGLLRSIRFPKGA